MQVGFGGAVQNSGDAVAREKNPFTPKAFLLRYWEKKIHNHLPKSEFLLSKASPLTAAESAVFAKLAATNSLSTRLPEFCSSAHLLCIPELSEKHSKDVSFAVYDGKTFTNDGSGQVGGVNPFKIYSEMNDRTNDVLIFHVSDNSSMDKFMKDSLGDRDRAPSKGETKRRVGSIKDMIDFSTSVLGPNVAVRSTENVDGSKNNVMVGSVKGINGGKVTKSVSCHQSMFPYVLFYCHSVPKVRVYEADLLDPNTKAKINHGLAICHLDTTAWSPTHDAFTVLGSGPGRIEVCHWTFENDMTWTIAE
ncbi:hypothetical protein L6164_000605 [Bauhinia variegata]|uniref:Uncharacterized protein n=1 Tax=Bauhinia variegata TaxID=167791 RepID=A0ACB9Q6B1_BAUVA|nr:hypothetical protein L6164_000605 [Bauhinia variegata]